MCCPKFNDTLIWCKNIRSDLEGKEDLFLQDKTATNSFHRKMAK